MILNSIPQNHRFVLPESVVQTYKETPDPLDPFEWVIMKRTYARRLDEKTPGAVGTEEWYQVCIRVIEGMFTFQKHHILSNLLPWNEEKAIKTALMALDKLFHRKWTPPGRGLWMMGTKFVEERGSACLNNCAFRSTKNLHKVGSYPFSWSMDALMLGVGVGFDTKGAGTVTWKVSNETYPYQIPDTREGWAASLGTLLDSLFTGNPVPVFDYSLIRPEGLPIRGFGGTSSGPDPLRRLHEAILLMANKHNGKPISSLNILDIQNQIGRCVVAGNVRRSAELAIGSPDDQDFMNAKDPALDEEAVFGWRWSSNNSINAPVGTNYQQVNDLISRNIDIGVIWMDNARGFGRFIDGPDYSDSAVEGFNPCVEMNLEDGELCNVVENFPARCAIDPSQESYMDWLETLKCSYLYAKTVTLIPTHWSDTNAIMLKNRRIGASLSGISQAIDKFGYRRFFKMIDESYKYIQDLDKIYSRWLCVPKSIRTTTVKPSGTVSLLAGATPGAHRPKGIFFIRRVRIATNDPLIPILKEAGYYMEPIAYGSPEEREKTLVVEFPMKQVDAVRTVADTSIWEQLNLAADLQKYWSDNGVSITIEFKPEESTYIKYALEEYEDKLKAVSFLAHNTKFYPQLPYEVIDEDTFRTRSADLRPLNKSGHTFNLGGAGEKFCDGDSCLVS